MNMPLANSTAWSITSAISYSAAARRWQFVENCPGCLRKLGKVTSAEPNGTRWHVKCWRIKQAELTLEALR